MSGRGNVRVNMSWGVGSGEMSGSWWFSVHVDYVRYLPPTTAEVYVFARTPEFVRLSVCKTTQKRVHGFG